ncbi:MAG: methyltransferase domain-containing protein [Ruminococcaceae bacterium]|nr:methyltransferase domain-containing protein [Oscillospiraceae bacterium]
MLSRLTDILVCPVCGCGVQIEDKILCCLGGKHKFDVAKEGYVNLAVGHVPGGDSKEAIAARTSFLEKEYYAPAAQALQSAVQEYLPKGGVLIDAGCGQGWYTNRLAEQGYRTVGFDLSKFGCARAAKSASAKKIEKAAYAVASVYSMPVFDACADGVVNIFAPCAQSEYARVLKPGGYLFLLGAGQRHLMGLKQALYSDVYENTERADLPDTFKHVQTKKVSFEITVQGQEEIQALFSMTPYYWRTSLADKEKLSALDSLTTEVDMLLYVYRK